MGFDGPKSRLALCEATTWIVDAVAPNGYSPTRQYTVFAYAHCVNA